MVYLRHMRGGLFTTGQTVRQRHGVRRFLTGPAQDGFSIVEMMIVLAVTGMLFLSAAIMISGRQNQTAFDQSIRQVQSQIQQAINEVTVGYFPNNAAFQCTVSGTGMPPRLESGSAAQGTNDGCIFLGKAMQFKVAGSSPEQFAVYTVAGLKDFGACTVEETCLANTMPMVVAPSSPTHTDSDYPDLSVNESLMYGLTTVRMWYRDAGVEREIGGVAFVNSLTRQSNGSVLSGTGQVNMIALDGTTRDASKLDMVELMNSDGGNTIADGILNPSDGIFICFENGATNDYGIVKIGGKNRELAVTLTIKDKDPSSPTCTA